MAPALRSLPSKSIVQPHIPPLRDINSNTGHPSHHTPPHPQDLSSNSLREPTSLFDSDTMSTASPHLHQLSPMSNATTLAPSISSYNPNDAVFCATTEIQMMNMELSRASIPPLQGPSSVVNSTVPPPTTAIAGVGPSHDGRLDTRGSMNSQDYGISPQTNSKFNDMIIESQDIDTSALGMDPLLWLDFIPQNILDHFESQNEGEHQSSSLTHTASRP